MVEYRPLDEDEHEVFAEYTSYAFQPSAGPEEFDPDDPATERILMGDQRGLFPDDAAPDEPPLSVCTHFWFDALVRGEYHPAPGLSTVATPPEHRRQGYVEDLLVASLEEYRSRGDRFSILWPFEHPFYRNFGWATCATARSHTFDPEAVSFARELLDDPGTFRQVDADEYHLLAQVYEQFSAGYPLSVTRDEEWWRKRVFTSWDTDPFVYVWEPDGEPRAYVVFRIEGEWGDRTLQVQDAAFLDHESFLAVCSFLANHDSQVSAVNLTLPPDVDLQELAPDPRAIECERKMGAMARIVDVAATVPMLGYPPVSASTTIAVEDPLVDWNRGVFRLEVRDGEASCERLSTVVGDGAEDESSAEVRIEIGDLTQLVVGYQSAAALEQYGRLSGSADAVATLDRLYPPEQPALLTGF